MRSSRTKFDTAITRFRPGLRKAWRSTSICTDDTADAHRSRTEHAAPLSGRAQIAGMSAAAGAHHVRADASRETQHQVGSRAACRGRSGPRESEQRQRASQSRTGADSTDIPVAGCATDLVGENRNLMPRRAQAVRRNDQIALGAAARAIETARQQRYPHRMTLRRDAGKRCVRCCRVIIFRAGGEVEE